MNVLDIFSGIGGFSLGLERTNHFRTVAFCEFDIKARAVLRKHWSDVPCFVDVRDLSKASLSEAGIEQIDVICGGFPCQDISLAGKGAGLGGERSGLWWEFHRLIKEIKPKYAIIENVAALRSRGLDQVLRSLAEIGYNAEWHCIPACAVGAPHQRDRIWIVAYPNSESSIQTHQDAVPKSCQGNSRVGLARCRRGQHVTEPYTHVAYPNGKRCDVRRCDWAERSILPNQNWDATQDQPEWQRRQCGACQTCKADANAANALCLGLEGQRQITSRIEEELENPCYSRWWEVEPDVGRVADGVSGRVDRLKQLGNAIVPQIAELIGRAICQNHKSDLSSMNPISKAQSSL